ncbi:MAG: hypothetical protein L3J41_05665 [Melioribacteraceae bacterium]|nr:hypothetical protein [Melioribacteraceae bacterium]
MQKEKLHLADNIGIEISNEIKLVFSELMNFQLEGRYPELTLPAPNYKIALEIVEKTKETLIWLQKKLEK